jgi:proteic killer suppression protein
MVKSFRHKGLKKLFEDGNASGIHGTHRARIENILALLAVSESLDALSLPSLRLHPLKGNLKGVYAVTVRANWRIVFRFEKPDFYDVDLVDYH